VLVPGSCAGQRKCACLFLGVWGPKGLQWSCVCSWGILRGSGGGEADCSNTCWRHLGAPRAACSGASCCVLFLLVAQLWELVGCLGRECVEVLSAQHSRRTAASAAPCVASGPAVCGRVCVLRPVLSQACRSSGHAFFLRVNLRLMHRVALRATPTTTCVGGTASESGLLLPLWGHVHVRALCVRVHCACAYIVCVHVMEGAACVNIQHNACVWKGKSGSLCACCRTLHHVACSLSHRKDRGRESVCFCCASYCLCLALSCGACMAMCLRVCYWSTNSGQFCVRVHGSLSFWVRPQYTRAAYVPNSFAGEPLYGEYCDGLRLELVQVCCVRKIAVSVPLHYLMPPAAPRERFSSHGLALGLVCSSVCGGVGCGRLRVSDPPRSAQHLGFIPAFYMCVSWTAPAFAMCWFYVVVVMVGAFGAPCCRPADV
jgi:hypothetical protein